MFKSTIVIVCLLLAACSKEDEATKETERLRREVETLKADKEKADHEAIARENDRLKAELAASKNSEPPSTPSGEGGVRGVFGAPEPTRVASHERPESSGDDAVRMMRAFTNEMCRCGGGDTACAQRVVDSQKRYADAMVKNANRNARPDPNLASKMEPIMADYTKCATKAMTPLLDTAPAAPAGHPVINEFTSLKENQQLVWKIQPGRYRVRVTTSNSGVKVRWIGAPCASSKEVKVYDEICQVASEAQLVVENPGGLTGLGPSEQVSVTATTI